MRHLIGCMLLCGGCLGEATVVDSHDLSANLMDLSQPSSSRDLLGVEGGAGDAGALYDCVQLNNCEKKCASNPKPQTCVTACRAMATSTAVTDELALQTCFNTYCPQATDAGTAAICTQGDMGFTAACTSCISNSQIAPANACSGGPECHQCYSAATACVADQ